MTSFLIDNEYAQHCPTPILHSQHWWVDPDGTHWHCTGLLRDHSDKRFGPSAQQRLNQIIQLCKKEGRWADLNPVVIRALAEGRTVQDMETIWDNEPDPDDENDDD